MFVDTAALPLWERIALPLDYSDAPAAVFLDMLTRVLEDGLISTAEYSRLDAIAEVAHLTPERISALHAAYLSAAVVEASADGILIAADPASQSGKAKTARAHGIPIVTEAEFIPVFDAFVTP